MIERCTFVIKYGRTGETVEDETESQVCLAYAEFVVSRPGVRPKYRCAKHAEEFRALGASFPDMDIRGLSEHPDDRD